MSSCLAPCLNLTTLAGNVLFSVTTQHKNCPITSPVDVAEVEAVATVVVRQSSEA